MAELSFAMMLKNDGSGNYSGWVMDTPGTVPAGGAARLAIPWYQNETQTETGKTITGATAATPIVVTSVAHGYSNGDTVFIQGILGNTKANGTFQIANIAADTMELVDSVGTSAWTSGGTVQRIAKSKNMYDALQAIVLAIQNYKAAGN